MSRPDGRVNGGGEGGGGDAGSSMDVLKAVDDWPVARAARRRFVPERLHGKGTGTERLVRNRLRSGSCSFLQFPNSPGAVGGPFKDLVPMLRNLRGWVRAGSSPPAG